MVRKLMKHELFALFRVLVWWMGAALLLSVLVRLSYELIFLPNFSEQNAAFGGFTFLCLAWIFALFALAFASVFVSAAQFFRSLFTGEGYMTFSLPVTATQLLLSKLFSAMIAFLSCMAAIVVSIFIVVPMQSYEAGTAGFGLFPELLGDLIGSFLRDPLTMTEKIFTLLLSVPAGILYFDLISSISQLFTKRRILVFVLFLFGVSFALSYVYALIFEPLIMLSNLSGHLFAWVKIALLAAFDVGAFFVIRFILTHKVNLVV